MKPQTSWNPLKCRGTDLPLNLTVMVKVLAIVVLLVNEQQTWKVERIDTGSASCPA